MIVVKKYFLIKKISTYHLSSGCVHGRHLRVDALLAGVDVIKLFPPSFRPGKNKLECLSLAIYTY
jgi:hypothetical protein